MIFETQHLLILAFFPIFGLIVHLTVSNKLKKGLGLILFFVFLPIFSGYDYVIGWWYEFLLALLIGLLYSLIIDVFRELWKKVVSSVLLFVLMSLIFGFVAFVDAFAGNNYVEAEWDKEEKYTVQYIRSQGFSGQPAFYYQIIHKSLGGLFEKVLDEHGRCSEDECCVVTFEEVDVQINICK